MVPEWFKKDNLPTISVKIMAGIPRLLPDEISNQKAKDAAYDRTSYGGSTRK